MGEEIEVEGRLGPSRGQSVSIRERGSRREGASLHLVAVAREAQGSFFFNFFFAEKQMECQPLRKINEAAIGAN